MPEGACVNCQIQQEMQNYAAGLLQNPDFSALDEAQNGIRPLCVIQFPGIEIPNLKAREDPGLKQDPRK